MDILKSDVAARYVRLAEPPFVGEGDVSSIEKLVGKAILNQRARSEMYRTDLAALLGVKESGLRRHEIGKTRLTVSRLIRLCEALNCSPVLILGEVAPHLFGATAESAQQTIGITDILTKLDPDAVASIHGMVRHYGVAQSTNR